MDQSGRLPVRRVVSCIGATLVTVLAGASSSAKTETLAPTVSVSIGQQLIDLKKAKEAGALSEQEYQTQRKRLIDSVR